MVFTFRQVSALALLLVALVAVGCGSSDKSGSESSGSSDERQVEQVSQDYIVASASGDWVEACELMSSGSKNKLTKALEGQSAKLKQLGVEEIPRSCRAQLAMLDELYKKLSPERAKQREAARKAQADSAKITQIEIEGDRATINVESVGRDPNHPAVKSNEAVKEGGEWKIDVTFGRGEL